MADLGQVWSGAFGQGFGLARQAFADREAEDEKRRKKAVAEQLKGLSGERLATYTPEQRNAYDNHNKQMAAQDAKTFDIVADPSRYELAGDPRLAAHRALSSSEFADRAASAYASHGFDDQAMQYGLKARDYQAAEEERASQREMRNRQMQQIDLQMQQTRLGIDSATRNAEKELALGSFHKDMSAYMAKVTAGEEVFDLGKLYKAGGTHGVPVDVVNRIALDKLGVDEKMAKQTTELQKQKIMSVGSLDGLLALADADGPGGKTPRFVQGKNGTVSLLFGDQVLAADLPANNLLAATKAHLLSVFDSNPMGAAVQLLGMRKTEAEINKLNSDAWKSRNPTAGGAGGSGAGAPALQPFSTKDFVEQAAIMGIQTQVDPETGKPVYTAKHKQLMTGTQAIMARTGLPMHLAMQQAIAYSGAPEGPTSSAAPSVGLGAQTAGAARNAPALPKATAQPMRQVPSPSTHEIVTRNGATYIREKGKHGAMLRKVTPEDLKAFGF
jgi:hypothetical protein